MVFSSVTFVMVFLPIVLGGYFFVFALGKKTFAGNCFLLASSLFFYAWGEPVYIVLLVASWLTNYLLGLALGRFASSGGGWAAKWVLILGVAANIIVLAVFKYANFIMENGGLALFNWLAATGHEMESFKNIALPLGISFYTFQGLSYLIDVYRKETRASRNVIDFGCYLTMFPQLVAGPIVRYASVAEALRTRTLTVDNIASGIERFVIGLAKKLLIADTCGRVADAAFSLSGPDVSWLVAWAGTVCYVLQIYYDFSGYSDMAIGLGRIFGFSFPENFNYPYISRSVREFWRRWHMTLSGWFRDYLYIPLGGNRRGGPRTYLNLLLVFTLCGFWHGASWMFVLWGLYHGFFLVLERRASFPDNLPRSLQHLYTILVFSFGWVIFRSENLTQFAAFAKGLCGLTPLSTMTSKVSIEFFAGDVYIALVLGILFAMPLFPLARNRIAGLCAKMPPLCTILLQTLWHCFILGLLLFCYMPLFGSTYNAFIYFRF